MSRRPPAPPPDLPGYTVSKLLGSGGFADVYLYEQHLPRRSVAVKVLLPGAADHELLAQFDAEANLMAALSTHPAIVTIHQAGISRDGRPYMVMEFCSRPNLSARYRAERLSVSEVLRIGVMLSGAVETAHRAGILHRDIKPANVLTTDFGHPVLSDFGISVQSSTHRTQIQPGAAVGMSIPWTAPEVFAEQVGGDERADVYSLAATLYTVLARRSPFDRPGGPNGSADLIGRIRSSPLPALGRSDVPPSLDRLLGRAMDKNRGARYSTALDLARALQQVESELRLAPTPIDVLDEDPASAAEQLGDSPATRVRALTVIEPEPGADRYSDRHLGPPATGQQPGGQQPGGQQPGGQQSAGPLAAGPSPAVMPQYDTRGGQQPIGPAAPFEHTVLRRAPLADPANTGAGSAGRKRSPLPALISGGLLVAVAALVAVLISTRGTDSPPPPTGSGDALPPASNQVAVPEPPAEVAGLTGRVVAGKAQFSWNANTGAESGDHYQWRRTDVTTGADATARNTAGRSVTIADPKACIAVRAVRDNGGHSDETSACARN